MFVLVQALTGIAFVLVLIASDAEVSFAVVGGIVLAFAFVLIWAFSRPGLLLRDSMNWVFSRKARPERVDYDLSRKPVSFRRYGTNTPPSVDVIRDLKSGTTNNWVPSRQTGGRSRSN
jgi:hypothetical protein